MMKQTKNAYLIVDIGTGNVRVAVVETGGVLLCIKRADVIYTKDALYPDALHFDPDVLWTRILGLMKEALDESNGVYIRAITASSQREGVVLMDAEGGSLLGLPNHDHRGREWESMIPDKHRVYRLTGRYPSSLFSALKIVAIRERRPEMASRLAGFMSISDWAQFQLSGIPGYEHSQASETLLYDVGKAEWSEELTGIFNLSGQLLPPLRHSGTVLGPVRSEYAVRFGFDRDTPVIVGGADTQLAIKSTEPSAGDIVIVSGTTTPVIRITGNYLLDEQERTWTNRHVEQGQFILETNCGVTGLNYQRLKEIFYPNEDYAVIESELDQLKDPSCVASLGSLVAGEEAPLTTGGFIFNAPVSHQLTRADFSWATLWDMACAIRENFDSLVDMDGYDRDYVWACGGGLQSRHLGAFVAGLIDKKIRIRQGFQQASVTGGAIICSQTLGDERQRAGAMEIIEPKDQVRYEERYREWKEIRGAFRRFGR